MKMSAYDVDLVSGGEEEYKECNEETIAFHGEEDTPVKVNEQDMKPPARLKGHTKIKKERSIKGGAKQTFHTSAGGKAVSSPISKEESIKLDFQNESKGQQKTRGR